MKERIGQAFIPAYVFLCLLLGGSAQGVWSNALLQLLGLAILCWAIIARDPAPLLRNARILLGLAVALVLIVLVQLVPLPPALWTSLPGRGFIAEGYRLLSQPLPWLPISVAPYETLAALWTFIPPIAVLLACLLTDSARPRWIAIAAIAGVLCGIIVGLLQVASPNPLQSPWYFYERTNHGRATGFFANANHMAAALAVSIPLVFAVVDDLRQRVAGRASKPGLLVAGLGMIAVLALGILLNGSTAILLLGPPVVIASALLVVPPRMKLSRFLPAAALAIVAIMVAAYVSGFAARTAGSDTTSVESRRLMWSETIPAIGDFLPVGAGAGTYRSLYPTYEDPAKIGRTRTSHAHNDYLELALELGLPGLVLLGLFLVWWFVRARDAWRSGHEERYALAAAIASGALLLHSLVDYPLRTAALASLMAACIAIMAVPRARRSNAQDDLWPTRHLTD